MIGNDKWSPKEIDDSLARWFSQAKTRMSHSRIVTAPRSYASEEDERDDNSGITRVI